MSTFGGKTFEYCNISIDRFDGCNLTSVAFFLSHCHRDHMVGLGDASFHQHLKMGNLNLYAHEITVELLKAENDCRHLSPYLVPLQCFEPRLVRYPSKKAANKQNDEQEQVLVTLLPAAHCYGSVMFLFEGGSGNVLYTGDIRLTMNQVRRMSGLHVESRIKPLVSMYVDSSFMTDDTINFPSREWSLSTIVDICRDWFTNSPDHKVLLFPAAKYGYEFLLRGLSRALQMKIHVPQNKFIVYSKALTLTDAITVDPFESRLHCCSYWASQDDLETELLAKMTSGQLKTYRKNSTCAGCDLSSSNLLVIKPSTLFFQMNTGNRTFKRWQSSRYVRVFYSMHSSKSEVIEIINYLKPQNIYPNVIPLGQTMEMVSRSLNDALKASQVIDDRTDHWNESPPEDAYISNLKTPVFRSLFASRLKCILAFLQCAHS